MAINTVQAIPVRCRVRLPMKPLNFYSESTIAKNQNTYAKRQREQEKKQRADEKRAKRDRKNGGGGNTAAPMHRFFTRPDTPGTDD
jgi:hypothetical protein